MHTEKRITVYKLWGKWMLAAISGVTKICVRVEDVVPAWSFGGNSEGKIGGCELKFW